MECGCRQGKRFAATVGENLTGLERDKTQEVRYVREIILARREVVRLTDRR